MAYEVTRDLPLESRMIKTPICETESKFLAGRMIAVVPCCAQVLEWWREYLPWCLLQRWDI